MGQSGILEIGFVKQKRPAAFCCGALQISKRKLLFLGG